MSIREPTLREQLTAAYNEVTIWKMEAQALRKLRDEVEPVLLDAKESQTAPHYLRIAAADLLDRFYKEKE